MTIEDYQLVMAETAAHAQDKISASQIRTAEYSESLMRIECKKAEVGLESAKQLSKRSDINTANHLRPALILRPMLMRKDDGWEAVFNELIAYGDTPELAYQNFDEEWTGRYEP